MSGSKRVSRSVSLLLALLLAWAPVLPSLAMMTRADDVQSAPAAPAGDHHDHAGVAHAGDPAQTPCTQHDSCNGQCCDLCAQCFSAVSAVPLEQVRPHPVQSPVLTKFHPRIFSASPDRPPRILPL